MVVLYCYYFVLNRGEEVKASYVEGAGGLATEFEGPGVKWKCEAWLGG